ncbi:MAG TPA: polysaccharide biosynthesis/export family protein [Vicinamibacterales bacterium]|nr:polysaccharide biosynthesis/export family protein [Vicinamibacterales bacterium]
MKRYCLLPLVVSGVLAAAGFVDAGQAQQPAPAAQAPASGTATPAAPNQQTPDTRQAAPQTNAVGAKMPSAAPAPVTPSQGVPQPPGYVIGPEDVLQVLYWREKELSAEVTVRPDGMISLPLLNDVQASGLTPEQLRDKVTEAAKRFIEDPSVNIVVKEILSRRVFITGQVAKPGAYPLTSPTTVLQLIAMAGGLSEFADQNAVSIMRTQNGKPVSLPFRYKDVVKRKNLQQNIELKPGDTVIVP